MGKVFRGSSADEVNCRADIWSDAQAGLQTLLRSHISTADSLRQTEARPYGLTPYYKYRTRASP
jgi:hypothetical protein